jgi:FLVCR family feline leukemia virus subgroup C receptor-related protein
VYFNVAGQIRGFRESILVVYFMALAGMLAFTFTLTLGHIWIIYLTIGFLG